ncbi:(2Fe-2S)-binding protein [Candidatus Poribacteria bacterium]|nr:(2Fe-2S)-binding protein [Candidatus Poribacteria bacterium]
MNPKTNQDMLICRCEEVTEGEIRQAIKSGADTISAIKRRTRAGMGLCQGHTCSKLIARIITQETGKEMSQIIESSVRPPIRPIKIKMFTKDKSERD